MPRRIRYSKKREAILSAIQKTDVHPTVDWVYQELKPVYPDLSLGTVYRNMRFLAEQGLIRSVGVVKGQERFDGDMTPHSHFICDRCGQVHDFPLRPEIKKSLDQITGRRRGIVIDGYELFFYGICEQCKKEATP